MMDAQDKAPDAASATTPAEIGESDSEELAYAIAAIAVALPSGASSITISGFDGDALTVTVKDASGNETALEVDSNLVSVAIGALTEEEEAEDA